MSCFGVDTSAKELVDLVGFPENFFDVHALDGCEAVFDEEGVRLPILGAGAAVHCCEVFKSGQVEGLVEGSSQREGKEYEGHEQHCDGGM